MATMDASTTDRPRYGGLTDVAGVRVGHAERIGDGWLTGVTAVVPPSGTVGAVDVRGGGPGTHETDALEPGTLVQTVDAVTLTGGSAHGLASVTGVRRWCEEQGIGFQVAETTRVPIVPAAAVFDLGRGGDPTNRPTAEMGYGAAAGAIGDGVAAGCVGAGTGAMLAGGTLKGGVGQASVRLPGGVIVAALAVANAAGSPLLPGTTELLAAPLVRAIRPDVDLPPAAASGDTGASTATPAPTNTTLAVIVTNARLDRAEARRMAGAGHDGLARALRPVHTLADGDTVFGLATGEVEATTAAPTDWPGAASVGGLFAVQAAAADAVLLAIVDAVLSARSIPTPAGPLPAYADR